MARNAVSTAAHGDEQSMMRCELDRRDDIRGARALRDECRPPIDGPIPDPASLVELRVARQNQPAAKRRAQRLEVAVSNVGRCNIERLHLHVSPRRRMVDGGPRFGYYQN